MPQFTSVNTISFYLSVTFLCFICPLLLYANCLTGTSGLLEGSLSGGGEGAMDAGAVYTGWLTQPTATPLQPMSHWAPTDYLQTDTAPVPVSASAFTSDVYVQPVCPSYTVVAPSSLLTLTHTPLFANIGVRWTDSFVLFFFPQTSPFRFSGVSSVSLSCSSFEMRQTSFVCSRLQGMCVSVLVLC